MLDTVGFITDLPHGLVDSFKATLDEVLYADVIVHVRDISHPHSEHQRETVLKVL
jgi:GTP-binding protein HflX